MLNTINCDDYKFSYSVNVIALRISDNSNVMISNFPIVVNSAKTSLDYLSISTTNYMDSPYIVSIKILVNFP